MRTRDLFVAAVFGAVALGFLAERFRREDALERFELPVRESPGLAPLAFPRGEHGLRGTIVDEHGNPADAIEVFVYRAEPAPGAEPLAWTLSDARGRFELAGLAAARYEAALVGTGRPPATFQVDVPAPDEVRWALPPALDPLPFLPEIERSPLAGRILPPAGNALVPWPLGGYEVLLVPAPDTPPLSGAVPRRTTTNESGVFRFEDLVRARYRLAVLPDWASGGTWPVLASAELDGTRADAAEPVLTLASGAIASSVRDQDGHPLGGALVKVWPADAPEHIWPAVQTDDAGSFEVRDLPPGRYGVRLRAGAAVREQVLEVRAGEVAQAAFEPLDLEERSP